MNNNPVWGVGIANAIKDTINTMQPNILQIGTVKTINPISVKLNNGLIIPSDFLYISQDLMNHKMNAKFKIQQDKVSAKTVINGSPSATATITINPTKINDELGSHSHTGSSSVNMNSNLTATTSITQTGGTDQNTEIEFTAPLKVGDSVLLANIDDGQIYIIMNILKKL